MIILLSPAKTLDLHSKCPTKEFTKPELIKKSEELIKSLKNLSQDEIIGLMKVSEKIAETNKERFSSWSKNHTLSNSRQAIFAFAGDVYEGLDAYSLSAEELNRAQDQIRILSGLYGILRPLDLIMPYRLEMGTKLTGSWGKNLYEFWGESILDKINEENSPVIVNLASNEYSKSAKLGKADSAQVITPIFKDYKNGEYKIISFYAKKARGLMARYIVKENVQNISDLKKFNLEGYTFNSQEKDNLIFYRRN